MRSVRFFFLLTIRRHKYDKERVLSFVPPDGSFKLMDYVFVLSQSTHTQRLPIDRAHGLPIFVKADVVFKGSFGKLDISVQSRALNSKSIEGVIVYMDLPSNVKSLGKTHSSQGKCVFDPSTLVSICKKTNRKKRNSNGRLVKSRQMSLPLGSQCSLLNWKSIRK